MTKTKLTMITEDGITRFITLPVDKDGKVRMTEAEYRAAGFTPARYRRAGNGALYNAIMSGGTCIIIENPRKNRQG